MRWESKMFDDEVKDTELCYSSSTTKPELTALNNGRPWNLNPGPANNTPSAVYSRKINESTVFVLSRELQQKQYFNSTLIHSFTSTQNIAKKNKTSISRSILGLNIYGRENPYLPNNATFQTWRHASGITYSFIVHTPINGTCVCMCICHRGI